MQCETDKHNFISIKTRSLALDFSFSFLLGLDHRHGAELASTLQDKVLNLGLTDLQRAHGRNSEGPRIWMGSYNFIFNNL